MQLRYYDISYKNEVETWNKFTRRKRKYFYKTSKMKKYVSLSTRDILT